jgi:hypothetical protein
MGLDSGHRGLFCLFVAQLSRLIYPMGETWDRCYDHNFRRFYPFSAKKLAFFSKTNVMITILQKLALFCVKNANIFDKFFGENILKIITSVQRRGKCGFLIYARSPPPICKYWCRLLSGNPS